MNEKKFKIAHLLGITREHEAQFRHIEKRLTQQGYIVFAPVIYNVEEWKLQADMLDEMCYQKLLMCDFCVLATPEHVGKSTSLRIRQAREMGKEIYVFEDDSLKAYL